VINIDKTKEKDYNKTNLTNEATFTYYDYLKYKLFKKMQKAKNTTLHEQKEKYTRLEQQENKVNNEHDKVFRKILSDKIEVMEIAKLPDILSIKVDEEDEKIKQEVIELTQEATDKISQMRKTEGEKIAQDLLERINKIESKIIEISKKSTGLIEEYVVKLEKRIKEILKTEELDKSRLAQEVVIYADKCSIEEEVTRLESHIYQFRNLISNNNETIGKKLDFLIQEMNRETNTIGSKANNLEITNGVIDIKTELEDIREQIQNIE
jgi:uncharacterized protein (TIGR00255 family)